MRGITIKKELAKKIRKTAENLVKEKSDGFEYFGLSLECMCAIASTAMMKTFEGHGFKSHVMYGRFVEGERWREHCWVEDETHIFDVTATQFNGVRKKVICLKKDEEEAKSLYKFGKKITNIKDFNGWPVEQKPHKKKTALLVIKKED